MVKKKQLEEFMEKNNNYCSFTDWSKGPTEVVTYTDIKEKFSDKFVFVALNPTKSCHAFHSGSPQDGKLKDIFGRSDNVYYITDLIKYELSQVKSKMTLKNSKAVVRNVKKNGPIDKSINVLIDELSYIGGKPTIIAFGNEVYELLLENKCEICKRCFSHPEIKKVYHFSDFRKHMLIKQFEDLGVIK